MELDFLDVVSGRLQWRVALYDDGQDETVAVNVRHAAAHDELEIQEDVRLLEAEECFVTDELEVL